MMSYRRGFTLPDYLRLFPEIANSYYSFILYMYTQHYRYTVMFMFKQHISFTYIICSKTCTNIGHFKKLMSNTHTHIYIYIYILCCLLNVKSGFIVVTDAVSVAKKGNHTLDGNELQVTVGTESDEEDSPGQHKATKGFPAAGAFESSSDDEDSGGWSKGQSHQQKSMQLGSGSHTVIHTTFLPQCLTMLEMSPKNNISAQQLYKCNTGSIFQMSSMVQQALFLISPLGILSMKSGGRQRHPAVNQNERQAASVNKLAELIALGLILSKAMAKSNKCLKKQGKLTTAKTVQPLPKITPAAHSMKITVLEEPD